MIPSHRLTTYGCRAFSVAGLMFWNSLPRNLRDPSYTAAVFGRSLKHFLSQSTSVHSASEAFATMRYINWCFTYLLTVGSRDLGAVIGLNNVNEWIIQKNSCYLRESRGHRLEKILRNTAVATNSGGRSQLSRPPSKPAPDRVSVCMGLFAK